MGEGGGSDMDVISSDEELGRAVEGDGGEGEEGSVVVAEKPSVERETPVVVKKSRRDNRSNPVKRRKLVVF